MYWCIDAERSIVITYTHLKQTAYKLYPHEEAFLFHCHQYNIIIMNNNTLRCLQKAATLIVIDIISMVTDTLYFIILLII